MDDSPTAADVSRGDVFDVPGAPWRAVSPDLARVRQFAYALTAVPVVVLVAALAAWFEDRWPWSWLVLGVAVVGFLAGFALVAREARSWAYAERDSDLFVRHGVLVRRLEAVPYGRMQSVEVEAGPLQRTYGIATLTVRTAAPGSDVRVLGVPGSEAARLRDRLTELGEAQAAGL